MIQHHKPLENPVLLQCICVKEKKTNSIGFWFCLVLLAIGGLPLPLQECLQIKEIKNSQTYLSFVFCFMDNNNTKVK